jgi:uncharacterized RDD family membrane protein YckC
MSGLTAADVGDPPVAATPVPPTRYAGLATRIVSFAIDAALITVVDVIIGVGAALILSLLHIPHELRTILAVIGATAYVLGSIAYFVIFWSTTGQTPGARLMQIQVLTADLEPVKPKRALVRCVGVILAALPLFLGFVPILYDSRRRGFQDQFAHTVVIDAPGPSIAEVSRAKKRAIYEASRMPASEVQARSQPKNGAP